MILMRAAVEWQSFLPMVLDQWSLVMKLVVPAVAYTGPKGFFSNIRGI